MVAKQPSQLFVSNFPSGNWVATGNDKAIITSESNFEELKKFCYENDTSTRAQEHAIQFTWPASMLEPPIDVLDEAGNRLFTDRGNSLTFDRTVVTDDDIRAALLSARQKFGNQLTLKGDDPVFTERMVHLADDLGIVVLNPELQSCIREYQSRKKRS